MTDSHTDSQARLKRALDAIQKLRSRVESLEQQQHAPIAVVGMGCRFPGDAESPQAYWTLLRRGIDAISDVPPERWDVDALYDPDPDAPGKMRVRQGGFLRQIDTFDNEFFRIMPREARHLDPQQRLLLEVAWEALEQANLAPDRLYESPTGVFIGISHSDYMHMELADYAGIDTYSVTGSAWSIAAGRLAYTLGLHGPCMAIDTACSSSLSAVHLACQSLRQGECNLALAGGVNLIVSPMISINFSKARLLAPDGRCKTFDAAADGYGRGEGCGVVVLKRLDHALADGDAILGVIRGSAINQDGRSSGITAPNGVAQAALLRQALANAQVQPHLVGYVEAHGTGTPLGDPIEVGALSDVLGPGRAAGQPLLVGSVKSNIGHLEAAAGIAGLCKVLLSLRHRQIPASLHVSTLNPHIEWEQIPVAVARHLQPWQPLEGRRIAMINSFGFSGTNVSLVVEEAPAAAVAAGAAIDAPALLPLSAHTPAALADLARRYHAYLTANPATPLAALARRLGSGRAHQGYRTALLAETPDGLRLQLAAMLDADPAELASRSFSPPLVAFLCAGQGPQYPGMGRSLYRDQPVFRAAVDRCAAIMAPWLAHPLTEVLFPQPGQEGLIDQTLYTPPAMFALEYGLAQLWMHWGIQPAVLIGHSFGEYVAACLAGVFSLEDGLRLVVERAALIDRLALPGAMASAAGDVAVIEGIAADYAPAITLAVRNGPQDVVLAGEPALLERVCAELSAAGIAIRHLAITHASHSPLIEPVLAAYRLVAEQVTYHPPQRPIIANLSGTWADESMACADYWCQHLRHTVRFGDSLRLAREYGCQAFVEIGPRATLIGLAGKAVPDALGLLPSLRPDSADWKVILASLGQLYRLGAAIAWQHVPRADSQPQLDLPTYPFQRQRHWLHNGPTLHRSPVAAPTRTGQHPLLGARFPSPLPQTIYASALSLQTHPWLEDHQVFDLVTVPGAALIELMLAAGCADTQRDGGRLKDIVIQAPLIIDGQSAHQLQVVVGPADGGAEVQIYSQAASPGAAPAWTLHASGRIILDEDDQAALHPALVELQAQAQPDPTAPSQWYGAFQHHGLAYGPQFQAIRERWRCGAGWLARLGTDQQEAGYHVHPIGLDASFQALVLPILEANGDPYLPFGVEEVCWFGAVGAVAWAYGIWRDPPAGDSGMLVGDIWLYAEDGALIATIAGLIGKKASRTSFDSARSAQDDLYQVAWQPQPPAPAAPAPDGAWVIWAADSALALDFARQAAGAGEPILLALAQPTSAPAHHIVVGADPAPLLDWLGRHACRGLIYLAAGDGDAAQADYLRLLALVQGLSRQPALQPVPLRIVTFGAQAVLADAPAPDQALLWGLGRTLANEAPELWGGLLDLDPGGGAAAAAALFAERGAGPDLVAYRNGLRYAQRIARVIRDEVGDPPLRQLRGDSNSTLDSLYFAPAARRRPASGEIEIRVVATGMNFRDIANALLLGEQENLYFGGECAGVVSAVGPDVTGLKVGDPVCAVAFGSYSTYVTVPAAQAARMPAGMTFLEAASLPIAFLTALYGLQHIAGLKAGDRVLIHAATGGVGMAAIQLARRAGATIFATAGSEVKREWLRDQGIEAVFNSRTLDFAAQIADLTGGEGVDVVLNSFTGDYIRRGLQLLKPGGHFIELGKVEILQPDQVAALNPAARYTAFDLGALVAENPDLAQAMLADVVGWCAQGQLRPLPVMEFPLDEIHRALRIMAQAQHIGKIVLSQPAAARAIGTGRAAAIRPGATYLISGGLGGLGLLTAGWLIGQGATHLALLGRSDPSPAAAERIAGWREAGAQVAVLRGDVASTADVAAAMTAIAALPPLRGIFHAAGSLRDGVLAQQSADQLRQVLEPKLAGAWNLHRASAAAELDYFVLFSSLSGVVGMAGQSNYAAANAFLDSLAAYRQARGLPGLSISWGAWSEVGLAAAATSQAVQRRQDLGINDLSPQRGLELLASCLRLPAAHLIAAAVDWQRLAAALPAIAQILPAPRGGKAPANAPRRQPFLERLASAPAHQRPTLIQQMVYERLQTILGLADPGLLAPNQRLFSIGLDSLMAVELRNAFQVALGQSLPATLLFDHSTPEALVAYLSGRLLTPAAPPERVAPAAPAAPSAVDEIAAMDDDLLDSFVNDMINRHIGTGRHHE